MTIHATLYRDQVDDATRGSYVLALEKPHKAARQPWHGWRIQGDYICLCPPMWEKHTNIKLPPGGGPRPIRITFEEEA